MSGCVGHGTTWQPCYIVARDEQGLAGALPLFIKYDSHGEFVFDWGWADAYERGGRNYYPKLVAAIPFTPATGQRLLLREGLETGVATLLLDAARSTALEIGASSLHVLFPTEPERQTLERAGFLARKGCQFHWTNGGYQNFDEFLARFSADKRKKAKRERRRVAEAGIVFEHLRGDEPTAADWDAIMRILFANVLAPRPRAVLEPGFFRERGGDDAEQPRDRACAAARCADRYGDLLSQQHDAVRPLLGQQRGLPQPAFRDLLLPRHRLLHPRALGAFRARHARRAQDRARFRAAIDLVLPLAARPRVPPSGRRVPGTRDARTWTRTWTSSASTFRIGKQRTTTPSSTLEPAADALAALAVVPPPRR